MVGREDLESAVAAHYTVDGLQARIDAALRASGLDPERPGRDGLAAIDEFHIGGRPATDHLIGKMGLDDGHYVLDVGSGIGGPARRIAAATGARVTGIDLTPAYTEAARTLTERVGLSDKARFETASALAMPFPDRQFDAAVTIHVAMNIADRPGLYREVARVLKPGARFGIYDVMTGAGGALAYPVPWAATPATSHLTTPDDMHALLSDAGFDVVETEDRSAAAIDFFKARDAAAARQPQAPGLHVIMGETAREKFANIRAGVERGAVAPVVIIARKR